MTANYDSTRLNKKNNIRLTIKDETNLAVTKQTRHIEIHERRTRNNHQLEQLEIIIRLPHSLCDID